MFIVYFTLFELSTLFLLCDSEPCTYDVIYIYIYMMRLLLQLFHLSLYMLFLFSLYTHTFSILYAILYFCFTLRCHDKFCLKCFRNTGCQSLSCHELSSCKVFEEIDFIVFNKWIWVEWFMTSLICSFVCCGFVTDWQRGRLLGHIWIRLGTYVNIELANPLTKCTLLVIG